MYDSSEYVWNFPATFHISCCHALSLHNLHLLTQSYTHFDCIGYATFWFADAGKSTIGGQILYLTNMVDERTIQKYEREAKDKNRESWFVHLPETILDSIIS